jgi:hypothetical protein
MGAADALITGKLRNIVGRVYSTHQRRPLLFWAVVSVEIAGMLYGLFRIYAYFSGRDV